MRVDVGIWSADCGMNTGGAMYFLITHVMYSDFGYRSYGRSWAFLMGQHMNDYVCV